MSLMIPGGPAFQFEVDNLTGTPPAQSSPGTSFTSGGGNADGTAVSILSALASDVHYLSLVVGSDGTATEDNSCLMDVLIDPAGGTAWVDKISDLIIGFTQAAASGALTIAYHFPLYCKSGSSIGVQARKNGATGSACRIQMWAFGEPKNPHAWWCGQKVESLGVTAATSKGTQHTPGATGTYSSFATIGTSTRRYGAIQIGVMGDSGVTAGRGYYGQIGASSAQLKGTPTVWAGATTAEQGARGVPGPIFVDIPAGTALQYRATSSGTADNQSVAFYGVY